MHPIRDGKIRFSRGWAPQSPGRPKSIGVGTWNSRALAARDESAMKNKDILFVQESHGDAAGIDRVLNC